MISPERAGTRPGGVVLKESVLFYLKYIIISFAIIVLVLILSSALGIEIQNVNSLKETKTDGVLYSVAMMTIIGPLMEESIFRLWNSFRREHIMISLFVITYVLLTKCIPHGHHVTIGAVQSDYFEFPTLKAALSLAAASSMLLIKETRLRDFAGKHGRVIILVSIIVFALLHLTNARCEWYVYPFLVCMCLPQFILGVSVTNLRLNIGFWAGFAFHCVINLITILLSSGDKIVEQLRMF
ncbi:MAG: CPBP family intramembrane metalloprotease [Bacteroidales bacterium]|nr:CPBP family intramembrane metalloprotease [Bacteroidales bacterium]